MNGNAQSHRLLNLYYKLSTKYYNMKKIPILLILSIFSIQMKAQFIKATAPIAVKKEHIRTIHGDAVNDNYYWMYDYFGKGPDSTNVVNYLTEENTYLDAVMGNTKTLQANLFTEMKGRIKEKDESVPTFKNGYFYYSRTEDGKQYFKYCRKKGSLTAKEEVILDVDKMAEGHSY